MSEQTNDKAAGRELEILGELELERIVARAVEVALDTARTDRANDIPFGDEDAQAFTPLWAELMLRELFEHHREIFGACLQGAFAEIRRARPGPKARP